MTRRGGSIRVFVLRAVDRCNGQPIPESARLDAARIGFPHVEDAVAQASAAMRDLELAGYLLRGDQELTGETLWALTDKGRMSASAWR